jgi:hypothetical protein
VVCCAIECWLLISPERYANSSESGKNNKLNKKNPIKLWPLRAATRAGQKAIAIQINNIITAHIALRVTPNIVVANISPPYLILKA